MKLGLLGKKASEKFIPDVFFNVKREVQETLLSGLLQSDGFITVWPKKKPKKAVYGWRLSSRKLAEGILTIFRQWGTFPFWGVSQIKAHLKKDGKIIKPNFESYDLLISTISYLTQTKKVWEGHKDAFKLESYLKRVSENKIIGKYIREISEDFVAFKVKKIKEIEG